MTQDLFNAEEVVSAIQNAAQTRLPDLPLFKDGEALTQALNEAGKAAEIALG